jgi:aspartyl-tRNA(Asn)/glutamyl-tRNA(Gln) amidotransferase subunit A
MDDPLAMYLMDIYTVSLNLAGLPGVTVPCGQSSAGLPIGMQLAGPHFGEPRVLRVAHEYQCRTQWHMQLPEIANLNGSTS